MIEKIKSPLDLKVANYKGTEFDIIPADTFAMVCRKINEIIELLNVIVVDVDGIKCIDGSKKAEQVDPYEKQRKWIGKICKFWNDDDSPDNVMYGELVNIFDVHKEDCPFQCGYGEWYEHCEPIKPDDDIIYKGEQ